ncbi:MAG: mandelate racemase/muconate lactonizing enzyme family protein [bacterium]
MKITDLEVYHVRVPLKEPFYPSWVPGYPQGANSFTLVRVKTDDSDIEGISAAPAMGEEAGGIRQLLLPFTLGRDPFNVEGMVRMLRNATFLGHRLWFIEVALWDIIGKAANLPVYRLLGGSRSKIRAYASTGEIRGAKQRVKDVLRLREQGFRAVKLRFHSARVSKDLEVLRAVRDAAGGDLEIMVDANQGWKVTGLGEFEEYTFKTAVRVARELEKHDVRWFEEPLGKNDYAGLAALRETTSVPIAGGEMNSDIHEFRELIERGCLDVIQPDATLSGGILNSIKVAGMAQAHDLEFCPHTWTNGIGLAANLQVMCAVQNCPYCEFPVEEPSWTPEARDAVLTRPFLPGSDGFIEIPDGPGLGIEIDEDALKRFGKKLE